LGVRHGIGTEKLAKVQKVKVPVNGLTSTNTRVQPTFTFPGLVQPLQLNQHVNPNFDMCTRYPFLPSTQSQCRMRNVPKVFTHEL
jgi:hypothetical protein